MSTLFVKVFSGFPVILGPSNITLGFANISILKLVVITLPLYVALASISLPASTFTLAPV